MGWYGKGLSNKGLRILAVDDVIIDQGFEKGILKAWLDTTTE